MPAPLINDSGLDSPWRARALIDLNSLQHNIIQIRTVAPRSRLMAVIKADAYGHGLETICRAIHNLVDAFAVATIAEGVQCRGVQDNRPVVVLSEFWRGMQLKIFEQYELLPVVHSLQQVDWLLGYQGKPLSVWIKVDSGMNRLGINLSDAGAVFSSLQGHKSISSLRIMSHLANADIIADEYTQTQLDAFIAATDSIVCEKSLANSAGVMRWPQTHYSWVRPGLMLYGAAPYDQRCDSNSGSGMKLKPVMQLQARLIAIKTIGSNQPVGYGGVFRTRRVTKIGMVGLGYGDGYPRLEDVRACVLIRDQRVPLIGSVSMDMITVDVTDLDSVEVGDEVTLWGHGLHVEEVAQWAGTIPYELLCKVTTRIPRLSVS